MTKQPVSIGWQTAFIFIPYVWIYAFYRIEKLRMGIVLVIIATAINTAVQMILPLPFPYWLPIAYLIIILIPVRFIRKWSREWNEKCERTNLS